MRKFLLLLVFVAACAVPPQKPPVIVVEEPSRRDVEFTATCSVIWQEELGRPIDKAALVECMRRAYAGETGDQIRVSVHDSEEAFAYRNRPVHFDPSGIPLEEIAAIRGAMWPKGTASTCGALPFGPRPNSPDNIIATDFITDYSPEQQDCIIAELKSRGYTHVVMGPFVDSDGYHGLWPPNDWRGANWERFLDAIQKFWDAHLVTVVFGHPDGWSFEQVRDTFTPLLQQPRAQKLIRIIVPHGWEPCRYECSSYTWAAYGQWARQVLPNALVLLHTVADIDAPVGGDARGDDNGHPNAEGWVRVAPFYHGWLVQNNAFECPTCVDPDPRNEGRTNFRNWQDQFNPRVRGSLRDRFEFGYAGWPKSSAWGVGKPLRVYAGEYSSYWRFWKNRPEAEGVQWGDAAMAAGAYGYLDSGSVPVPVR
jgi:hypothetical protein